MRKSVSAFVFGLISGLFCWMWAFIFALAGETGLTACDFKTGEDSASVITTLAILGWIGFAASIVVIIGACQCFKNARRGAIIMTSATVPASAILVYVFSQLVQGGNMVGTLILLFLLPVIFLIVADVCAFLAKDVEEPVVNPYGTYMTQPTNVNAAPKKTMEEELTELKSMYEKNLMTESEYNQAKQGIINKYTNK
ncbi:MAG: SHOCT domain-containing protein [Clostridia bacterium]|nr:SHOCT domain-containing protein [Clostridia bacterium]